MVSLHIFHKQQEGKDRADLEKYIYQHLAPAF